MRSSNLINPASVTRALHDMLQGLDEKGQLGDYIELVDSYRNPRVARYFPAFDLLTPSSKFPAYKWFLPKPRVSVLEFLRVYDQFAEAVHTEVENPADVAAKIYARHSDSGKLLTHFKHHTQWLAAAHTLLAAALWLGAELEENNPDGTLRMRLGTGLLEVSPQGVWSNTRKATLKPAKVPAGHAWPLVPFPVTASDNPILLGFWPFSEHLDPVLRRAATLIAIALKEEVVNRGSLRAALNKQSLKILSKSRRTPDKIEAATAALQQCTEILEEAEEDVIQALHEAAVPRLMPAARFRSLFGVASQADPLREVRETTREKWRLKLEQEFNKIQDAVV